MANKEQTFLEEQKDQIHSIKALGDTDGGKELVALLVKDVVVGVHHLVAGADHVKTIAEMKARMELAQLILNAEDTEKELDILIAEALSE